MAGVAPRPRSACSRLNGMTSPFLNQLSWAFVAVRVTVAPVFALSGADSVVSPNAMGGLRMVSDMLRPEVTTFLDTMLRNKEQPLRIAEIPVPQFIP